MTTSSIEADRKKGKMKKKEKIIVKVDKRTKKVIELMFSDHKKESGMKKNIQNKKNH